MEFWKPIKYKQSPIKQSYWKANVIPIWQQRNDDKRLGNKTAEGKKIHGDEFSYGNWKVNKNPELNKMLKNVHTPLRVIEADGIKNEKSGAKFAAVTDYKHREIVLNKNIKMTPKVKKLMVAHELGHFKLREKGIKPKGNIGLTKQAMKELRQSKLYEVIKKEGYPEKSLPEEVFATYYEKLKTKNVKDKDEWQKRYQEKYPTLHKEFNRLADENRSIRKVESLEELK
jgi:hypothetical protein